MKLRIAGIVVGSTALVTSLMGAKGCGSGPLPGTPSNTPGVGKKHSCGYSIEGAGGHVTGTFDISDDGRPPYRISSTSPVHGKSRVFRCDRAAVLDLRVGIEDGRSHRLQCKLFDDGQQVDEDHAGTFIRQIATDPHVHCNSG